MCGTATARGTSSATVPYVMRGRDACGGASPGAASHVSPESAWRSQARTDECVAVARRQSTEAGARACSRRARVPTSRAPRPRLARAPHAPRTRIDSGRRAAAAGAARACHAAPRRCTLTAAPPPRRTATRNSSLHTAS